MKFISYTLATLASLCFVSGLIILTNEGDTDNGATRNVFRHV